MKLKTASIVFFCLFICFTVCAQNKIVGKVVDFKKEPVVDAKVYLDDKLTDATINIRGYFEVEIPEGVSQINIYSPTCGLLSTEYSGESNLSFIFLKPMKTEKEKISIGYGEVDRESLTYAVDKIDAEQDLSISGYSNIYDYMRGKLPGVRVTNDNKIMIRGISSLSISSDPYALNLSSDPLFVVNGAIVNNIDFINVNEIKNISVLKDASASIYGSRGTNGVILINLKR
jgi:TonB-dependent SusC/RagA subfamily outer membrane receptor